MQQLLLLSLLFVRVSLMSYRSLLRCQVLLLSFVAGIRGCVQVVEETNSPIPHPRHH